MTILVVIASIWVTTVLFILTAMLTILTTPYIRVEGTYKPHCKEIKLLCNSNSIVYKSYHKDPLCEGEVIEVDKPVKRGMYYESFFLTAGTRIETPHKVFEQYEFKKWLKFKKSKESTHVGVDGFYVIVSEVPYMKYTIRKTTYCKERVEFVCDHVSTWIPISDYHFIETDGDYIRC
jgi:hypothetical protein